MSGNATRVVTAKDEHKAQGFFHRPLRSRLGAVKNRSEQITQDPQ